jgi:hypothetical protein
VANFESFPQIFAGMSAKICVAELSAQITLIGSSARICGKLKVDHYLPLSGMVKSPEIVNFQVVCHFMQAFKVYISSTYKDLIQHRKAVREFFHKFPGKFEVIGMEDYVAGDSTPVETCVEDVNNCDFYILILGNRYGYIPDSTPAFDNPGRLSITHLEYQAACKGEKKIFAFLVDKAFEIDSDDKDVPELEEWKQQQLTGLKNDIRAKKTLHKDGFTSTMHLALMVSESMIKASEKYKDLLQKGNNLITRYIDEKRVYCLDRASQFNEYKYARITGKSPFNTIIIQGNSDSLVESLQKRITDLALAIPVEKMLKTSLNEIFGSRKPEQYETAKRVFFNVISTNNLDYSATTQLKNAHDFVNQVRNMKGDNRLAFILNWETLSNGTDDPRIGGLQGLLHELYEACLQTGCNSILFFINIIFKAENEKDFDEVVDRLLENNPADNPYIFSLGKMDMVPSEDIGLWIDQYITDVPLKKDNIIKKYLNLSGEFPMNKAQTSVRDFVLKVNAQDPEALNILN